MKIISLLFGLVIILALTGCTSNKNIEQTEESPAAVVEQTEQPAVAEVVQNEEPVQAEPVWEAPIEISDVPPREQPSPTPFRNSK
ncbi:MAG: hypothetical protein FWD22_05865 [Treponema sp.]|nr:hypothetical protein [Treponema sp.]